MKTAFLVAAVALNAAFAGVVFWWLAREYRRARAARCAPPPDGPPAERREPAGPAP